MHINIYMGTNDNIPQKPSVDISHLTYNEVVGSTTEYAAQHRQAYMEDMKRIKREPKEMSRSQLLRWHPHILNYDEDLKNYYLDFKVNKWELLKIDLNSLREETDDNTLVIVKEYDDISENWSLVFSKKDQRYYKVFGKKLWRLPATAKMLPQINSDFVLSYIDSLVGHDYESIPKIYKTTENYILGEWLAAKDGWKPCVESDFGGWFPGTERLVIEPQVKHFVREFHKLYKHSAEYAKSVIEQRHIEEYKNLMRQTKISPFPGKSEKFGNDPFADEIVDNIDNHKFYLGIHNAWAADFACRINPVTKRKEIKFIDLENFYACNATDSNYWYHMYKIITSHEYLSTYVQLNQLTDEFVEHTGQLEDGKILAHFLYKAKWYSFEIDEE